MQKAVIIGDAFSDSSKKILVRYTILLPESLRGCPLHEQLEFKLFIFISFLKNVGLYIICSAEIGGEIFSKSGQKVLICVKKWCIVVIK